jgi:hypothetical protein
VQHDAPFALVLVTEMGIGQDTPDRSSRPKPRDRHDHPLAQSAEGGSTLVPRMRALHNHAATDAGQPTRIYASRATNPDADDPSFARPPHRPPQVICRLHLYAIKRAGLRPSLRGLLTSGRSLRRSPARSRSDATPMRFARRLLRQRHKVTVVTPNAVVTCMARAALIRNSWTAARPGNRRRRRAG